VSNMRGGDGTSYQAAGLALALMYRLSRSLYCN
jgi:hypothetical protein